FRPKGTLRQGALRDTGLVSVGVDPRTCLASGLLERRELVAERLRACFSCRSLGSALAYARGVFGADVSEFRDVAWAGRAVYASPGRTGAETPGGLDVERA